MRTYSRIKENGKKKFEDLLEKKLIIHNFIWEYNINKINKNDPFAISKFEKDLKKIALSIHDDVLKKYILDEDKLPDNLNQSLDVSSTNLIFSNPII